MPNWCGNYIKLEGKVSDIIKSIEGMKGKRPCYACEADKISDEAKNEIVYTFNATVPVPAEIQAKTYHEAGYAWQSDNWGTKWDMLHEADSTLDKILKDLAELDQDEITSTGFGFSTAWGPPENWFTSLAMANPEIDYTMHYEEGGCEIYGTITARDSGWSETTYETEAEYVYYADYDCDIEETFDTITERNEHIEVKSEFIERLTKEFEFYEDQEYIIKKINDYADNIDTWEDEEVELVEPALI